MKVAFHSCKTEGKDAPDSVTQQPLNSFGAANMSLMHAVQAESP